MRIVGYSFNSDTTVDEFNSDKNTHPGTEFVKSASAFLISAVVFWTMFLCSCGHEQRYKDARSEKLETALKQADDSLATNSEYAKSMIISGMKKAEDSLEYYDWYMRFIRYNVRHSMMDTVDVDWKKAQAFLTKLDSTPRVNGMIAFLQNAKGYYYHRAGLNPYETISFYQDSYRRLFNSDIKNKLPDVCANLGDAYIDINDVPRAAMWYRRALFLADSLELPEKENISLYMGLGRIYFSLGDFDDALKCYKVTESKINLLPLNMKAFFLNNYGNYYYYIKDYKSALKVFLRLKKLLEESDMQETYEMYLCKLNMADVYLNLEDTANARRYLTEAEAFFKEIGDKTALYYHNTISIGLELKANNMAAVKRIIDNERLDISPDYKLVNIRQRYLREYYVRTGNYRMAYENLKGSVSRNDSLKHNVTNMRTSEIMMRYSQDTLQLHHQIEMQEKDADIRKANYGLYSGLLLAALFGLLLFAGFTWQRKRSLQMHVELMGLKLMSARNRISPHFIFNVLNNRISNTNGQDAEELMALAKLIRANLNLSGKSYVSLKEELDFVRYYISVERSCLDDDFSFEINAPADRDIEDVMIPSMFIQILVENSIKHGLKNKKGSKILRVDITRSSASCLIKVSDNGGGFDIRHSDPNSTKTGLRVIRSTISMINSSNKRKIKFGIRNIKDEEGNVSGCEVSLDVPPGLKDKYGTNAKQNIP